MKIRTTQPKNNKYYIRTVSGGYNGAVAGQPTISGANVLCNCVGYANGRFNEIGEYGKCKYQLVCNAENFIEAARKLGLKISSTPIQGGIMVWQKGSTLSGGDGAGHVAVVEEVYEDGSIMTSESGWNAWAFKTVRRNNSNGRWGQGSAYRFRGCIINPAVKNPKVVPTPKLVVDGIGGANTVRAMQKFFGTPQDGVLSGQNKACAKYYPALKAIEYGKGGSTCVKKLQQWLGISADGVWGKKTSKALQKKLGVTTDGIFGTNSMKVWQKYLNDHDKATMPPSWVEKANAWAKKIAADDSWHYVTWSSNAKTHECPICHDHPKGKFHGWNCIGFSFAYWHHGGGLNCNCNCGVIDNSFMTKLLTMNADDALKQLRKKIGLKDLQLIRNNKKNIPQSKMKAGDLCLVYDKNNKCIHIYPYIGNGYMIDCGGWSDTSKQIAKRKASPCKAIIRYTGK